jgi:hypothetical protein
MQNAGGNPNVFLSYSSTDRQTELLDTIRTMLAAGLLIGRVMIVRDGSIMIESREQGRHRDPTDSGNT